ncbi:uncharacterized protein LOC135811658 [Sycon ciliatum]|uniref:uncharacterized protein LOC135811658 n=1 Tax=Sycon ciliatum TaxID=27933 RepID=UPI0031F6FCC2
MAGYLPVMIIQARDADECANQNHVCQAPEICHNTLGGFKCSSSRKPTSRAFTSTSPTLRMTTGSITSTPWPGTLRMYLTSNKSSKLNTGSTSSTVLIYPTEVPLITAFTQPSVQASALVPILIAIFAVLILLTCCCAVISFYLLRSGKILPYSTSNLVTHIRRVHSQGARPSERPAASNWDDGMRRESQLSNVSIRTTEATEEAVAYSASGPAGPVTSRRLSTKYRFEDSCASVSKRIGATEEVQTCSSTFQSTAKHGDDVRGGSKMEGQQLKHDEVLIGGKAAHSPNKPPHLDISRVILQTRNATVGHASAEKNESEDAVLDIFALPMEKNPAYEMAMAKEDGATGNTEDGPASTMASTGERAALPGLDLPSKSTRVPVHAASTTQRVGHPDDVISSQPIYTAPDKLQFACKDASAGATGLGLGPQPAGTVIYDEVILKVNIGGNPSSADNINSSLEPTIYAGVKNLSKARSE